MARAPAMHEAFTFRVALRSLTLYYIDARNAFPSPHVRVSGVRIGMEAAPPSPPLRRAVLPIAVVVPPAGAVTGARGQRCLHELLQTGPLQPARQATKPWIPTSGPGEGVLSSSGAQKLPRTHAPKRPRAAPAAAQPTGPGHRS